MFSLAHLTYSNNKRNLPLSKARWFNLAHLVCRLQHNPSLLMVHLINERIPLFSDPKNSQAINPKVCPLSWKLHDIHLTHLHGSGQDTWRRLKWFQWLPSCYWKFSLWPVSMVQAPLAKPQRYVGLLKLDQCKWSWFSAASCFLQFYFLNTFVRIINYYYYYYTFPGIVCSKRLTSKTLQLKLKKKTPQYKLS